MLRVPLSSCFPPRARATFVVHFLPRNNIIVLLSFIRSFGPVRTGNECLRHGGLVFREQRGAAGRGATVPETVEENRSQVVPAALAHHKSAEHIQRKVRGSREPGDRFAKNRRRRFRYRRRWRRPHARDHRHRTGQNSTICE